MANYRVFAEKKELFRVEAEALRAELNENLQLNLGSLRLVNVYDLFGFSAALVDKTAYGVFGEKVTDLVTVSTRAEVPAAAHVAIECLPGQFDQRASSAEACVKLVEPGADIRIKSAQLLLFGPGVGEAELAKIRRYLINPVDSREKDLSVLAETAQPPVRGVKVLEGFRAMGDDSLAPFCGRMGLAMSPADLREVVSYFTAEGRDPSETELRILDTYWSDHCRHTTFSTVLTGITVEDSFIKDDIEGTLRLYLRMRRELRREDKPLCLMDIATAGARYLRTRGLLDDMEESEENNACSIYVDVDNDGRTERWLLMFKNETHNHPTEIEPFGGAATCLGGAIRDPLSGRSYVYQAMRITGAGDIWKRVSDTMPGKLPQKVISRKAAQGYSSYGNQIGLATTQGAGGEMNRFGNIASMKSNGVEISLTTQNIRTKDFSWTTNLIYSHTHNEVTELKTAERIIDLVSGSGFAQEGYPVRSLFSIPFMGLNDEGLPTFLDQDGNVTTTGIYFQESDPERLKFLKYSGSVDPTDVGSLGNVFTWKGLTVNAFITYSFGNVVRLDPVFSNRYNDLTATPKEFKNRWMVKGDEALTDIPVISSTRQNRNDIHLRYAYNAYNYSDARIAKGDFIRLKEVSVGYDFPKSLISPLHLSNLSLKLQATNLFLIYADKKLNGQDPEFTNSGGVAVPMPKQFTLTLRLGL
mgnify:CR=1 FL=1